MLRSDATGVCISMRSTGPCQSFESVLQVESVLLVSSGRRPESNMVKLADIELVVVWQAYQQTGGRRHYCT